MHRTLRLTHRSSVRADTPLRGHVPDLRPFSGLQGTRLRRITPSGPGFAHKRRITEGAFTAVGPAVGDWGWREPRRWGRRPGPLP